MGNTLGILGLYLSSTVRLVISIYKNKKQKKKTAKMMEKSSINFLQKTENICDYF